MLQTAALLLITGPGLNGVLGAVSLYIAGASLRSGHHTMVWAAALVALTWQWVARAIDPFGPPTSTTVIVSNLFGVLAALLYAQGFRLRRGDAAMTPGIAAGLGVLALVIILCLAVSGGRLFAMIASSLRSLFLIVALSRLFASRMRISLAEMAVAVMLATLIVLQAALSWVWMRTMFGQAGPHETMITQGFASGPPSSAVAIFTLLLIASDYASQRRSIVHTDPLTGILNRLGLSAIAQVVTRRGKRPLLVAIADIDHFKAVNDRFGHGAGDAVLSDFAACLAAQLRPGEVAARVGGEEFALLLHERHDAGLERIEEMRRAVAERRLTAFPAIAITASFGVAEHRRGETLDGTMGRADLALYRSKRGGRNRSTLADAVEP